MKIVKVAKEHKCLTCGETIKKGEKSLCELFDSGSYTGRHYYCRTCAKVILKELDDQLEIVQELNLMNCPIVNSLKASLRVSPVTKSINRHIDKKRKIS